mgnify:CR=1 FL=1
MPLLEPFFNQKFKVSYYIIPHGRNPLPVWRSREVTLTRATNEFVFTREELKELAQECAGHEVFLGTGGLVEVPVEQIEIVGIIPLAD